MDLDLTPEQRHLDEVSNRMLAEQSPLTLARTYLEGGADAANLWKQLLASGWYGIGHGDEFGSVGVVCLARAIGRHVTPSPLVDTAVVARMLSGGSDRVAGMAAQVVAGEATTGLGRLVSDVDGAGPDARPVEVDVAPVTGVARHVVHGAAVDVLALLVGSVGGRPALLLLEPSTPGLDVRSENAMDASLASVSVSCSGLDVGSGQIAHVGEGALHAGLQLGAVLSAAEAVGAAGRSLDMAVEYARTRQQFGRAIGSFQSLQHLIATAHVHLEAAWSTVLHAAATLDEPGEDEAAVGIAKVYASRAAREAIETAIQVFGGIAFTWEHDAHLLQRRVLAANERYGSRRSHEDRLVATLRGRLGVSARG